MAPQPDPVEGRRQHQKQSEEWIGELLIPGGKNRPVDLVVGLPVRDVPVLRKHPLVESVADPLVFLHGVERGDLDDGHGLDLCLGAPSGDQVRLASG